MIAPQRSPDQRAALHTINVHREKLSACCPHSDCLSSYWNRKASMINLPDDG